MIEKVNCPVCKGSGKINEPSNLPKDLREQQVNIARTLFEKHYSMREIMRVMNYKSPRSVQLLLANDKKQKKA